MTLCATKLKTTLTAEPVSRLRLVPTSAGNDDEMARGLKMLSCRDYRGADNVFTQMLNTGQSSAEIWMAAGMARLNRGAHRAARTAFLMCAWLSDDPVARKLAWELKDFD